MPRCWPFRFRSGKGAASPTKSEDIPDSGSSATGSTVDAETEKEKKDKKEKDKKDKKDKKEEREKKKKKKENTDEVQDGKESGDGSNKSDKSDESHQDSEDKNKEKDKDEGQEKPRVPMGSVSGAKHIYRGPKDDDGNWIWVDKCPDDIGEAAENDETATYAVVVRNQKSNDSRKNLEAHSIIVQSPWIRAALAEIMADYPGVACELTRLEFEAPFQPFLHRW